MTIKVTLINPSDRRFYQAQWDDPVTGKTKTRSTGTTIKREAERFAGRLEDDLNAGTYRVATKVLWSEVRTRYETEVSASKALKTRLKTQAMFNAVDEFVQPRFVDAMADPNTISKFGAKLREPQTITTKKKKERVIARKEFTIHGHLAELRKVLRWAHRMGLIRQMPHIEFPVVSDGMKGRPVTAEEFDRILAAVPKVKKIRPEFRDAWIHFLRGLWMSSLRIAEALKLHWTVDRELSVDFSGRHPMFRIQAKHEKGRTFRLLPMTPEFAAFLQETPVEQRTGYVFNPWTASQGRQHGEAIPHRATPNHIGRIVSECGKMAGVKVNDTKSGSAHDFRRSFGYRWSKLLMPKVLQELMRHRSIQTTMQFYVGHLADDAADIVWKAAAQQTGNSSGNTPFAETEQQPQTP